MEGIRYTDMVVGLLADLGRQHEADDAGHVGLVGQGNHVEHQCCALIKIGNADRNIRQFINRQVTVFLFLHAAFNFPDAGQVVVEQGAVGCPKAFLQNGSFIGDHVQQTHVVAGNLSTLGIGPALTKELGKEFLGAELHWQRRGWIAPRYSGTNSTTIGTITGRGAAFFFCRNLN